MHCSDESLFQIEASHDVCIRELEDESTRPMFEPSSVKITEPVPQTFADTVLLKVPAKIERVLVVLPASMPTVRIVRAVPGSPNAALPATAESDCHRVDSNALCLMRKKTQNS